MLESLWNKRMANFFIPAIPLVRPSSHPPSVLLVIFNSF
ncbi:hypothetical protein B4168_1617 [Anoxybacillus flavithermus]|nr:hypothetical protein B4168_1617 [Anoxybacillus flavithermus]OAO84271.1 hypothetical protein GT23_3806 [Parageobacillus thermoglucosidasius]